MTTERLMSALGAEPPDAVRGLPETAQNQLAALVEKARRNQARDLEVAFEGVLKHVPFPVRPLARKMLRG